MEDNDKDEYPCYECGEMVDVEDYCYNDGLCCDCVKINEEIERHC